MTGNLMWRIQLSFILFHLSGFLLFAEAGYTVKGTCSCSQQSCQLKARVIEDDPVVANMYDLVKSIYQKIDQTDWKQSLQQYQQVATVMTNKQVQRDGLSLSNCDESEMSDDALWETLQHRLGERKKRLEVLQNAHTKLFAEYEAASELNNKQLASLEHLGSQLNECHVTRRNLLANISDLVAELNEKKLHVEQLNLLSKNVSALKEELSVCQSRFSDVGGVLRQLPEFSSPHIDNFLIGGSSDEETDEENFIIAWKRTVGKFTNKLNAQKSTIAALEAQVRAVRADNERLQASLSTQTSDCNDKYRNCVKNVSSWKRRFDQMVKQRAEVKPQLQNSNSCFNTVSANLCSFEEWDIQQGETCWFERLTSTDFYWRVVSNKQLSRHEKYQHVADHTCGSSQGRFLFLDMSRLTVGQQAKLTSVLLFSESLQCFSFWYKVDYVFNVGRLYIIVMMNSGGRHSYTNIRVWSQSTSRQGEWQFAKFEIPKSVAEDGYKVQFIAESNGSGFIAVDDLAFTQGTCEP